MNTIELLNVAALESKYSFSARLSDPKSCFIVILSPQFERYDLQREPTLKAAIKRLRWKEVNVFAPAIGIVRNGVILAQCVDQPALPTLKERFHRMSNADPMYYTFMKIWSRLNVDRSIADGLWLAEENAAGR